MRDSLKSIFRIMRTTVIAILLALAVALAFVVCSHLGGTPAEFFLAPGTALRSQLPNAVIAWLDPVPEFTQDRISTAVLSFGVWWLVLVLAATAADAMIRRKRTRQGAIRRWPKCRD